MQIMNTDRVLDDVVAVLIGLAVGQTRFNPASRHPDAKAAAKVIEAINRILKETEIDSDPLYREAEGIEAHIKSLQQQAKAPEETSTSGRHSPMYG